MPFWEFAIGTRALCTFLKLIHFEVDSLAIVLADLDLVSDYQM